MSISYQSLQDQVLLQADYYSGVFKPTDSRNVSIFSSGNPFLKPPCQRRKSSSGPPDSFTRRRSSSGAVQEALNQHRANASPRPSMLFYKCQEKKNRKPSLEPPSLVSSRRGSIAMTGPDSLIKFADDARKDSLCSVVHSETVAILLQRHLARLSSVTSEDPINWKEYGTPTKLSEDDSSLPSTRKSSRVASWTASMAPEDPTGNPNILCMVEEASHNGSSAQDSLRSQTSSPGFEESDTDSDGSIARSGADWNVNANTFSPIDYQSEAASTDADDEDSEIESGADSGSGGRSLQSVVPLYTGVPLSRTTRREDSLRTFQASQIEPFSEKCLAWAASASIVQESQITSDRDRVERDHLEIPRFPSLPRLSLHFEANEHILDLSFDDSELPQAPKMSPLSAHREKIMQKIEVKKSCDSPKTLKTYTARNRELPDDPDLSYLSAFFANSDIKDPMAHVSRQEKLPLIAIVQEHAEAFALTELHKSPAKCSSNSSGLGAPPKQPVRSDSGKLIDRGRRRVL